MKHTLPNIQYLQICIILNALIDIVFFAEVSSAFPKPDSSFFSQLPFFLVQNIFNYVEDLTIIWHLLTAANSYRITFLVLC
jgi:hypothetical protein